MPKPLNIFFKPSHPRTVSDIPDNVMIVYAKERQPALLVVEVMRGILDNLGFLDLHQPVSNVSVLKMNRTTRSGICHDMFIKYLWCSLDRVSPSVMSWHLFKRNRKQ